MSSEPITVGDLQPTSKWQPLGSHLRRIAGVLVEKAKTVPDSYPMTLNAIISGCNQKNNRDPQLELNEEQVQQAIEDLRQVGAVIEIQSSGRVSKYKHLLYQWLGVDEFEMAVMAELLLRGAQTIGELRGRASRMNAIPDLGALQQILASLVKKNLVVEMTSSGRGQIVSHNLYKERELAELKARFAAGADSPPSEGHRQPAPAFSPGVTRDMFAELQVEVSELRAEVSRLREEVRGMGKEGNGERGTGEE